MRNVATCIGTRHTKETDDYHYNSQPLESNLTNEKEIQAVRGVDECCGCHYGKNRGRRSEKVGAREMKDEVREGVERSEEEKTSGNSSKEVNDENLTGGEMLFGNMTKPMESQHIEKNMEEPSVNEAICKDSPRGISEKIWVGGKFDNSQQGIEINVEKDEENAYYGNGKPDGDIEGNEECHHAT